MQIIKELSNSIEREIEDIEKYATLAIRFRQDYPSISETLYKIALQENDHMNMLHDSVTQAIKDYKAKHGDPPESMNAVYDYLHQREIDEYADAKVFMEMYKK